MNLTIFNYKKQLTIVLLILYFKITLVSIVLEIIKNYAILKIKTTTAQLKKTNLNLTNLT